MANCNHELLIHVKVHVQKKIFLAPMNAHSRVKKSNWCC